MSKNLFDGLSPLAAFATKLFSAAGLDLAALHAAGNPDALKLHLASLTAAQPDVAAAITQATAQLSADVATAHAARDLAASTLAETTAAFTAAGIPLDKVAFKKGDATANAAAVKAALQPAITAASRTELARHGIKPLDDTPAADPTKKAPGASASLTFAEFNALNQSERISFARRDGKISG